MGSGLPPPFHCSQRGLPLCAVFQGKTRVCLLGVREVGGGGKWGQEELVVGGPFISCDCPQSIPGWTLLCEHS